MNRPVLTTLRSRWTASLLALSIAVGPAATLAPGEWTALMEQPCGGTPICGFHLEVWCSGEPSPRCTLDVPVEEGCGEYELDISELVKAVDEGPDTPPPQIRVWSVSCSGVRSESPVNPGGPSHPGYDWTFLDLGGRCAESGTGSEVRGDADQSGELGITDAIAILQHIYLFGPLPCGDLDSNMDGAVDISDPVRILIELFL